MFFLATGMPKAAGCSYKGGGPAFVRVWIPHHAFPSYDGNGSSRAWAISSVNHQVGMLFIDFERPSRLAGVNGRAEWRRTIPSRDLGGRSSSFRVRAEAISPTAPLHPQDAAGRDLGIRALRGAYASHPRMEDAPRLQRGAAAGRPRPVARGARSGRGGRGTRPPGERRGRRPSWCCDSPART